MKKIEGGTGDAQHEIIFKTLCFRIRSIVGLKVLLIVVFFKLFCIKIFGLAGRGNAFPKVYFLRLILLYILYMIVPMRKEP